MMKSKLLLPILMLCIATLTYGQNKVGIGTTTPQAKLDVNGTFKLQNGVIVNGISADSTFTPGSDSLLPTQLAVKRYLERGLFAPKAEDSDSLFILRDDYNLAGANCVFASGNYMYATYYYQNLLRVFDISNPDSISWKGTTSVNLTAPQSVRIQNGIAYVANYSNQNKQLTLFNVSDPANIVPLGYTGGNMTWPTALDVVGNIAYVGCGFTFSGDKLFTLDVSDPNNIVPLGQAAGPIIGNASEVKVKNGFAYVLSTDNLMSIFDVSNPAVIVPRGSTTENLNYPSDLAIVGNYAYVVSSQNHKLIVFDISDPDNIVTVGFTSDSLYYPFNITSMENKLVVANSGAPLRLCLFNISNPTQPEFVSSINNYGGYALRFNAQGRMVYTRSTLDSSLSILEWTKLSEQQTLTLQPNGTTEFKSGWQTGDMDNIYRNDGNVGIGTSKPKAALHVAGNVKIDKRNTLEFGANVDGKHLDAGKIGYNTFSGNALDIVGAGSAGNRKLKFYAEGGALLEGKLRITDSLVVDGHSKFDGNVLINNGWLGINNYAPTAPLHLSGYMKIDGTNTLEFGAGVPGKDASAGMIGYNTFSLNALDIVGAGTPNNRKLQFYGEGGSTFNGGLRVNGLLHAFGKLLVVDSATINAPIKVNGNLLVNAGWVGIGNTAPTVPLHLSGNMKIDATNTLEFGAGVPGKDANAGKIGYTTYSLNALDIVGAGTPNNRKLQFYGEGGSRFQGKIYTSDSLTVQGHTKLKGKVTVLDSVKVQGHTLMNGNLKVNSGNLLVNSGWVGIGNMAPTVPLHLSGNMKIDNTYSLEFGAGIPGKNIDAGRIGYTLFSNGLDIIGAGATSQRRITLWGEAGVTVSGKLLVSDSIRTTGSSLFQSNLIVNGNLGIQTSTPSYKLDVNGRMRLRHNGETSGIYFNKSNNTEGGFIGMFNDTHIGLYGVTGGIWNFFMNTTNGNVGIGTTTPTASLHVGGNQKMNSTNSIEFGSDVAGKNPDAGKIGYQTFTTGALDIVGAGSTDGNRKVKIYDKLDVSEIISGAWNGIDLLNGWDDYGNGFATSAYYKDPLGVMHFRGMISGGSTSPGTVLFTLPVDQVPQYGKVLFMVPNGSGVTSRIEVLANGNFVYYGSSNVWVSLDQISYRIN